MAKRKASKSMRHVSMRTKRAIDDERRRLMRADAVLHSVAMSIDADGGKCQCVSQNSHTPDYPDAIEVARELVNQAILRLELIITPELGRSQGAADRQQRRSRPIAL